MRRLRCVECRSLMDLVRVQPPGRAAVTLDLCPDCGGIWFDRGELAQAARARVARAATTTKVEQLCPVCEVRLFEEEIGEAREVGLACSRCRGLWAPGAAVDRAMRLHPTVAGGPEPEAEEKPWSVQDAAPTCDRCGGLSSELAYSFTDPPGWLCHRCHGETSWNPLERLEAKVEGAASDAIGNWFKRWIDS